MNMKLQIICKEYGRGKGSCKTFKTLTDASKYIQDRWQGAEYCGGEYGFHTDYSTYELVGFTLADIGTFGWDAEYPVRTFKFANRVAAKTEAV